MAPSLGAKEPLSNALRALEAEIREKERHISFFSRSNDTTAAELMTVARTELATLERERTRLMGELKIANDGIAEVREHTRLALLPELSRLAVPEIDARLYGLAVIDAVQRLVGRTTPLRSVRQSYEMEKSYLEELKALLTPEGR